MVEIKTVMKIGRNSFAKLRGLVHFKKSAQEIKEEMREGWKE